MHVVLGLGMVMSGIGCAILGVGMRSGKRLGHSRALAWPWPRPWTSAWTSSPRAPPTTIRRHRPQRPLELWYAQRVDALWHAVLIDAGARGDRGDQPQRAVRRVRQHKL